MDDEGPNWFQMLQRGILARFAAARRDRPERERDNTGSSGPDKR
jgi:hypothetical protein